MKSSYLCAILASLAAGSVLFGNTASAESVRNLPEAQNKVLVYSNGFENSKAPEVNLMRGFRYAPGEGVNGSTAVRTDRVGDPARGTQWGVITLDAKMFKPRTQYTYSFMFRAKDLRCTSPTPMHFVLAQVGFIMPKGKPAVPPRMQIIPVPQNEDFKPYSLKFTVPEGVEKVRLVMQHRHYYGGSIWFDNIKVESDSVDTSAAGTVFSGKTPSAESIKKFPVEQGKVLVYNTGFENPKAPEVTLMRGFRYAPGEGMNGNAAVRSDRIGDPARGTQWAVITLDAKKFQPQTQYTYSFMFRTKDLRCALPKPVQFVLAQVGFIMPKGKPAAPPRLQVIPAPKNEDFKPYSLKFTVPEGAEKVRLTMQHRHYYGGSIWFDDIKVESDGVATSVLLNKPNQSTFTDKNGNFVINYSGPKGANSIFAVVELEQNGKVAAAQTVLLKDKQFKGDFGSKLVPGAAKLNVWVGDVKKQRLLVRHTFNVQVKASAPAPANAVLTDEYGRMIVNGKPFMPIGMFLGPDTYEARQDALTTMGKVGMNVVMDYGSFFMQKPNSKLPLCAKRIYGGLDAVSEAGLRILFSLQNVCQVPQRLRKFDGVSAPDAILKKLIPGISGHPALLGWYMNDEMDEYAVPQGVVFRELVNALDPWHPTVALTNLPSALPNYARTGDHIALDTYPLHKIADGDDISRIGQYMKAGADTGLACWGATQIFSWGLYNRDVKTPADYAKYHKPDPVQVRAMNYLYAIGGARAFLLYTYPVAGVYAKKAAQVQDVDWHKRVIGNLPEMVAPLKLAEPYIMGKDKGPAVTVENRGPALVEARAFRSDAGKIGVLIVGCGGKPGQSAADAVITVPGALKLKSHYGRTQDLGNGKYRFTAQGADSDLLTE